jgi:hypothetical protein
MTFSPEHCLSFSLRASLTFRRFFPYLACICASLVTYTQSASSQVFGGGPDLSVVQPNFSLAPSVNLGTSFACPVPTFNIGAFGGSGEDFANSDSPLASSNRGIYNYGVSVGFSIPFGSSVSDFCKGVGKSRAAFERTRTENQLRNSQLSLLQQCYWLQTSGFLNEKNKELFKNNESFSSLRPCVDLDPDRRSGTIMPGQPPDKLPESNTDPSEKPPEFLIQDTRK